MEVRNRDIATDEGIAQTKNPDHGQDAQLPTIQETEHCNRHDGIVALQFDLPLFQFHSTTVHDSLDTAQTGVFFSQVKLSNQRHHFIK